MDVAIRKKRMKSFLISSVVSLVVGVVYEVFSHGVYSPFMYMMWVIPILLGVVPIMVSKICNRELLDDLGFAVYFTGVVSLMIASFFKGVLEIYGTDSKLVYVFVIVGIVQIIYGISKRRCCHA